MQGINNGLDSNTNSQGDLNLLGNLPNYLSKSWPQAILAMTEWIHWPVGEKELQRKNLPLNFARVRNRGSSEADSDAGPDPNDNHHPEVDPEADSEANSEVDPEADSDVVTDNDSENDSENNSEVDSEDSGSDSEETSYYTYSDSEDSGGLAKLNAKVREFFEYHFTRMAYQPLDREGMNL
jgi:hypothetical protein